MRINYLLSVVIIALLGALTLGCSSTNVNVDKHQTTASNDTLTIRNQTSFGIDVFKDGAAWKEVYAGTAVLLPVKVDPHGSVILDCRSSKPQTGFLRLEAMKITVDGCVIDAVPAGSREWSINFGTNNPAKTLVIRSRDFKTRSQK